MASFMLSAHSVVFVLLLLQLVVNSNNHIAAQGVTFEQLRAEKEEAVTEFSRRIRERFKRESWCTSGNKCNDNGCAQYDCSGDVGPEAKCQHEIIALCECQDEKFKEDICPATSINNELCSAFQTQDISPSGNKGQLLNRVKPTFRTPKGTITSKGDDQAITITEEFLKRDVCSLKHEATALARQYNSSNLTAWLYAGTEHGAFMIYPGHVQCRGDEGDLFSCDYNPTERPWYITAATGDRDIVFLYDRNLDRSTTLGEAFEVALNTTDERDAISVRAFDESEDTRDWFQTTNDSNQFTLRKANNIVKREIINELPTTGISKASNIRAALRDAFRTFHETSVRSNCNRFIVVMLGSDDKCFSSSSCSTSVTSDTPCKCISETLAFIEDEQSRLVASGGDRATLVIFTEAPSSMSRRALVNMEGMASTIACSSPGGLWHRITKDDTPNTAMNPFTQV